MLLNKILIKIFLLIAYKIYSEWIPHHIVILKFVFIPKETEPSIGR